MLLLAGPPRLQLCSDPQREAAQGHHHVHFSGKHLVKGKKKHEQVVGVVGGPLTHITTTTNKFLKKD